MLAVDLRLPKPKPFRRELEKLIREVVWRREEEEGRGERKRDSGLRWAGQAEGISIRFGLQPCGGGLAGLVLGAGLGFRPWA